MFCQNCGAEVAGNFCNNCGAKMGSVADSAQTASAEAETVLWEGQPSGISGKMKSAAKVNSVKYKVTSQRIIIESGLIGKKQDEIELGRIKDYKVSQSIAEKLQNIGDITVVSTDASSPVITLENIENPNNVKEIIRNAVMQYRSKMNIHYRENV